MAAFPLQLCHCQLGRTIPGIVCTRNRMCYRWHWGRRRHHELRRHRRRRWQSVYDVCVSSGCRRARAAHATGIDIPWWWATRLTRWADNRNMWCIRWRASMLLLWARSARATGRDIPWWWASRRTGRADTNMTRCSRWRIARHVHAIVVFSAANAAWCGQHRLRRKQMRRR